MIQKLQIHSREQWLAYRQQDVTASVAGALLGVHEYQTPFGLYALKSGIVTEDVEETPAMQRGLLLEPVALKLMQRLRPAWKFKWNGDPGELNGFYYRDAEMYLGATPDCSAIDEDGRKVSVQVKTVERNIFRRNWFNADDGSDEYDPREIVPPLWTVVQAIVEAYLTNSDAAVLAPLVIGSGLDQYFIDVPIHMGIIDRLRDVIADFYRRIREKDAPDPDYGRDAETIRMMFPDSNGLEIDLHGDNELPGLLDEHETLTKSRAATVKLLDECKSKIRFKIGPNNAGFTPGWEITNKLQSRAAFTSPESSFRVLRVKRLKTSR